MTFGTCPRLPDKPQKLRLAMSSQIGISWLAYVLDKWCLLCCCHLQTRKVAMSTECWRNECCHFTASYALHQCGHPAQVLVLFLHAGWLWKYLCIQYEPAPNTAITGAAAQV